MSTKKLSDQKINVAIRTHPGATVSRQLNKHTLIMAENDSVVISNLDAVVLHVGTNNITDADSATKIVEDLEDTAETILIINPNVPIIVSSILPRKEKQTVQQCHPISQWGTKRTVWPQTRVPLYGQYQ